MRHCLQYNTADLGLPADHMIFANHQALAEKAKQTKQPLPKQKTTARGALRHKAVVKNQI